MDVEQLWSQVLAELVNAASRAAKLETSEDSNLTPFGAWSISKRGCLDAYPRRYRRIELLSDPTSRLNLEPQRSLHFNLPVVGSAVEMRDCGNNASTAWKNQDLIWLQLFDAKLASTIYGYS